jgi:hypothetical protein
MSVHYGDTSLPAGRFPVTFGPTGSRAGRRSQTRCLTADLHRGVNDMGKTLFRVLGPFAAAALLARGAAAEPSRRPPIREVTLGRNHELRVNGEAFFPLIMTLAGHWHEGHADVAAGGFNAIDIYGTREDHYGRQDLDKAWANRLYGVVTLNDRWQDMAELAALVRELRDHPALLVWALPDEPDTKSSHTPELIRKMYDTIRAEDPRHPVWLNMSEPQRGGEFSRACDIISEDSYPVQKTPYGLSLPVLRAVQLRHGAQEAPYFESKPLWAYVQTYRVNCHDLDTIGPAPTTAQVRCMAYMLVANGVTGLAFYSFHEGGAKVGRLGDDVPGHEKGWRLPRDETALWAGLQVLNREIQELAPVILSGPPQEQVDAQALSATSVPTDQWGFRPMHVLVRRWGDALYVIAANGFEEQVTAQFQLAGLGDALPAAEASVQFEDRAVKVALAGKTASFRDDFAPHAVHVYRIPNRGSR